MDLILCTVCFLAGVVVAGAIMFYIMVRLKAESQFDFEKMSRSQHDDIMEDLVERKKIAERGVKALQDIAQNLNGIQTK